MAIAVFYCQELKEYDFGKGHSFRGERFSNFIEFFQEKIPPENFKWILPQPATDEDLRIVHSQEYIDFVEKFYTAAQAGQALPPSKEISQFLSIDNLPGTNPGKLNFGARLIAGAAKKAGELVWQGKFEKAITFGGLHHAKKSFGEGFCIFNDVALCAENLKRKFGAKRILILDTDAHAGNGTMEYFYSDPEVLFIDLHQDPKTLYPGTGFANQIGEGEGRGYTINIPLPPFAGDGSYRLVFEEVIEPIVKEFKPEIILRNGGSDPHFADQLTQLGVTIKGFRMIGEKVREMAKTYQGKVVDFLASGYNKEILVWAWLALISGLMDWKIELKEPITIPPKFQKDLAFEKTKKIIETVKKNLKNYWPCLS